MQIPGHGSGDDAESGFANSFEADRPIPLGDAEVMHLCGKGGIFLFADNEFIVDDLECGSLTPYITCGYDYGVASLAKSNKPRRAN